MGAYAQNSNSTFHTNRKVNMTRKRGGALERRMQKIRGGRIVINHENNTFKIVRREETENGQEFSNGSLHARITGALLA